MKEKKPAKLMHLFKDGTMYVFIDTSLIENRYIIMYVCTWTRKFTARGTYAQGMSLIMGDEVRLVAGLFAPQLFPPPT
jgi:hypothetical protein